MSINNYNHLLKNIGQTIEKARFDAVKSVNCALVKGNWEIGQYIVEYEQLGNERAEYGSELLIKLSKDLRRRYGKGFGRRNVLDMRRFYLAYPKWQTVSAKLSWSHFIALLGVSNDTARTFYENKAVNDNWSKRELERQIDSSLFERMALSRNKKGVIKNSPKKQPNITPKDVIKDPYILDFLKIPNGTRFTEKHLEQKIIDNLQLFLLELGKGFTFVGRQHKISLRNKHFYVDLVFYHRILRCFVLIDLKTKALKHSDIGQMNLYLNYFKTEENTAGDHNPIGIILAADKDEIMVEYAMGGISNKIFLSKYELYLPDKKSLQNQIKVIMES